MFDSSTGDNPLLCNPSERNINNKKLKLQKTLSYKSFNQKPQSTSESLADIYEKASTYQLNDKIKRYVPQVADKVLDAPDLIDDFYLNLID